MPPTSSFPSSNHSANSGFCHFHLTKRASCLNPTVFLNVALHSRYNERTRLWLSQQSEFINQPFYLNDTRMKKVEMKNGAVFPVSDACHRQGDPPEGCIYTPSIYFSLPVDNTTGTVSFTITNGGNLTYLEDSLPMTKRRYVRKQSLRCNSEMECEATCKRYQGVWVTSLQVCNITVHLNSLCYRFQKNGREFALDTSRVVSSKNVGCFSSRSWSPYRYRLNPPSTPITIDIRYNLDPVISSSLLTSGCSDTYLFNSTLAACFGRNHEDQISIARTLLIVGMLLFCIETIVG